MAVLVAMGVLLSITLATRRRLAIAACLGILAALLMSMRTVPRPVTSPPPTLMQTILSERLDASTGRPESTLIAALVSGVRSELPVQLKEDFRQSGLSHLLSVSGYNVTLVAHAVAAVLGMLIPRRRLRTVCTLVAILLFVVGAGASAAVVRAGLMGGLVVLVHGTGTPSAALRTLLVAAALMVAWDPSVVGLDVGFQLSVVATAAILLLSRPLEHLLRWCPTALGVRASLTTTLAATLGTLPILAWHFGSTSLVGPLANVAAAPLVPLAMLGGSAAALGGGSTLGLVTGRIAAAIAWLLEQVAQFFGRLPWATHPLSVGTSLAVLALGILAMIAARLYLQRRRRSMPRLLLL